MYVILKKTTVSGHGILDIIWPSIDAKTFVENLLSTNVYNGINKTVQTTEYILTLILILLITDFTQLLSFIKPYVAMFFSTCFKSFHFKISPL